LGLALCGLFTRPASLTIAYTYQSNRSRHLLCHRGGVHLVVIFRLS
jgi:hypothetical protein